MLGNNTQAPIFPFWPYYGYYDLGPVQIPPVVSLFGLTDETTGKVLYLIAGPDPNRLSLTDTPVGPQLNKNRTKVYTAFDGPAIGSGGAKLRLNNNHLLIDTATASDNGPGPWVFDSSNALQVWLLSLTFYPETNLGGLHLIAQPQATQ